MSEEQEQVAIEIDEVSQHTIEKTLQQMNGMGMRMGDCLFQVIAVDPKLGTFTASVLNKERDQPEVPDLVDDIKKDSEVPESSD